LDYKYLIQLQAEDILFRDYGKEFYDLSNELQCLVYNRAEEAIREKLKVAYKTFKKEIYYGSPFSR